jgi:hypothetical protein
MPITGAVGRQVTLPDDDYLAQCKPLKIKDGHTQPTDEDWEMFVDRIRKSISQFVSFSERPIPTTTVLKRTLEKVVTASKRVRQCLISHGDCIEYVKKLQARLKVDIHVRDLIHRKLTRSGVEFGLLELESILKNLTRSPGVTVEVQRALVVINKIVETRDWSLDGKSYPNPHLVRLTKELADIWFEMTGYSPKTYRELSDENWFVTWADLLLEPARSYQTKHGQNCLTSAPMEQTSGIA